MRKNLKILGVLLIALTLSLAYVSCAEEDDQSTWQGKPIPYLLQGSWGDMGFYSGYYSGPANQPANFVITASQMTYLSYPYKLSLIGREVDLRMRTKEQDLEFLTDATATALTLNLDANPPANTKRVARVGRTIASLEADIGEFARRLPANRTQTNETTTPLRVDLAWAPIVGPVDLVVFNVEARTYMDAQRAGRFWAVMDVNPDLGGRDQLVIVRNNYNETAPYFLPPVSGGFAMEGIAESWFSPDRAPIDNVYATSDLNMNANGAYYALRVRYAESNAYYLVPIGASNATAPNTTMAGVNISTTRGTPAAADLRTQRFDNGLGFVRKVFPLNNWD